MFTVLWTRVYDCLQHGLCVCVSIMSLVYELSSCPGVVNSWDSYTHMDTLSIVCVCMS